jgi:hypothetical protein
MLIHVVIKLGFGVFLPTCGKVGLEYIEERPRKTPVTKKVDVTVVGGGVAGVSAAIAAARNGAKTLLIERYGVLGGTATIGLMGVFMGWDREVNKGVASEVLDRLIAKNAAFEAHNTLVDPESLKLVLLEMVKEAGVELMLYSFASDVIMEQNSIKGVILENKSGRQAVLSKVVVDATGDGDIAALAGAPFQLGRPEDGQTQPVTVIFSVGGVDIPKFAEYIKANPDQFFKHKKRARDSTGEIGVMELNRDVPLISAGGLFDLISRARGKGEFYPHECMWLTSNPAVKGEIIVNATHVMRVNPTDADQLTKADIEARMQILITIRFLRKYVPGFEECYLTSVAEAIGVRESRRILGEYVLTGDDILKGRRFSDVVAKNACFIDIHGPIGSLEGQYFEPVVGTYDIPYRCLIPKSIEHLLVSGRCISADHVAHSSIRSIPGCMVTGQAAGTAAALASKKGITPRQLNIKELQNALIAQGFL